MFVNGNIQIHYCYTAIIPTEYVKCLASVQQSLNMMPQLNSYV